MYMPALQFARNFACINLSSRRQKCGKNLKIRSIRACEPRNRCCIRLRCSLFFFTALRDSSAGVKCKILLLEEWRYISAGNLSRLFVFWGEAAAKSNEASFWGEEFCIELKEGKPAADIHQFL
jgi:hypothetical protein